MGAVALISGNATIHFFTSVEHHHITEFKQKYIDFHNKVSLYSSTIHFSLHRLL